MALAIGFRTVQSFAMLDRSFTATFLAWFATADLGDILRPEPCPDRDAVYLHFLVGDAALEGWVCDYDLSVGAIMRGECWDLLYTDELAEKQSEQGWSCDLCLDNPPRHYPSLEQLWIAHLFEPFGRWCNETLRAASGVCFYGDGVTWAKLGEPEDGAVCFQTLVWRSSINT